MNPTTPEPTNPPVQDAPLTPPTDTGVEPVGSFGPGVAPADPQAFGAPATDSSASVFGGTPTTTDASSSTVPTAGQPGPFGQPAAPVAGGTPAPMPPSKPGNGKKIAIIGGIVGGVILLAIAGIVAFLLFNTVSKQDYADAAKQYNATSLASSELTTSASSLSRGLSSSSDEEFDTKIKEVEAASTKLADENKKLGELKAVRVGEGKEVYDTFNKKLGEYLSYANGIVASVKSVRPALVKCGAVSGVTEASARVAALNACSTGLNGVTDLPNPEFKTYVDSIKVSYAEFAKTYESMSKLTSPFGSQYEQYKTLRDQMYDSQDDISAAGKTFTTALNTRDDEVSVKDSATALGKFLTDQQR